MTQFGVTTETKSRNITPFGGGFTKAVLTDVKTSEIGKDEVKYRVLDFTFMDIEGIKTHVHREFAIKDDDAKREKKMGWQNSRIKHLFETFYKFPATGLGVGATSWDEYFQKIADAFNTGREGKKIFVTEQGDKEAPIIVWTKTTFDSKNQVGFPLMPNFLERIGATNQDKPKSLVIDKRYDKVEQSDAAKTTPGNEGVFGAGSGDLAF